MYKGLAVAYTTVAAEGEADSLSDPSDVKYLGDDCVGVNLHRNACFSQHSHVVSSARTAELSKQLGGRVILLMQQRVAKRTLWLT